jgi:branched-chain amino acid transport system ATP-binding protein
MLVIDGLEAAYGLSQVLFGITLRVDAGRLVTLMGRNGMGKTTTVRAMMGLLPIRAGHVRFEDTALHGLPAHRIAQAGLGLVPEGRQVFPNLSVYENLVATAGNRRQVPEPWTVERVYGLFPQLAARARSLGGTLSGGEQQMLAIARALMGSPRMLMLDEPSGGLAPRVVAGIGELMTRLRRDGLTILLVEQNIPLALGIADYAYVVVNGAIRVHGTAEQARRDWDFAALYLTGRAGASGTP